MKFLYTAFFLFAFCTITLSQRVATASSKSDFKTIKDGFVESVFNLDKALSDTEKSDIQQWAAANEPNMYINVSADNKQLTLRLSPEYNIGVLYDKTFHQLGVEEVVVSVNAKTIVLTKDKFVEQIGS